MCIVGYIGYLLLMIRLVGLPENGFLEASYLLSMTSNLYTTQLGPHIPGPYWYFGLMLQLYIVYRLFLFRRSWNVVAVAIIISCIAQAVVSPDGASMEWLRNNFIGSLLPFGLGLLYARYEEDLQLSKITYALTAIVSIALIFVTSLSFISWITTPFFVCTLGISLSAAIFVSHPIVRKLCLNLSDKFHISPYLSVLTFLIGALFLGIIFQPILDRSTKFFLKLAKH